MAILAPISLEESIKAKREANGRWCSAHLLRWVWLEDDYVGQAECSRCQGYLMVDLSDTLGQVKCLDCYRNWSELRHYTQESALPAPPSAIEEA